MQGREGIFYLYIDGSLSPTKMQGYRELSKSKNMFLLE